MAPNKGANAGKTAAKAAKRAKQADKAARKEVQALKVSSNKAKGEAKLEEDEDDLDAILERYQQEMQAVRLLDWILTRLLRFTWYLADCRTYGHRP